MTNKFILPIFWALVGIQILVIILAIVSIFFLLPEWGLNLLIIPAAPSFFLGLALLILAVRTELNRNFKIFQILIGASAVGFIVSSILHNLVSGLFPQWFGGDEPFFFMIAVFVCPTAYLVGIMGSIVLIVRKKYIRPVLCKSWYQQCVNNQLTYAGKWSSGING